MKKLQSITMLVALLLVCAVFAQAGQVYDRSSVTTAAATGIGTITPTARYAGLELKKAWVEGAAESNVVATVYRVIDSGTVTQSVATVTCAANLYKGSGVPSQYAAIKSGEYFYITALIGAAGTNATVYLDYEVQTHD
jgi:hypothetical protein